MKNKGAIKKQVEFYNGQRNHYLELAKEAKHIGDFDYRLECLCIAEKITCKINALEWVLEEKNTRGGK